MLDYPRALARGNMELHSCIHAGNFDLADQRCRQCEYELECDWLLHTDLDAALRAKPPAELVRALEFALSYVDARVTRRGGHSRRSCPCEACRWLRDATALSHQLHPADPPDGTEADP